MRPYGTNRCALHSLPESRHAPAERSSLHKSCCQISGRITHPVLREEKQQDHTACSTRPGLKPLQKKRSQKHSRKDPAKKAAQTPLRPILQICSLALIVLLPLLACSCALTKNAARAPDEQKSVDQSLHDAANVIMADLARLTGSYQSYDASHAASPLQERMNLRFEGPLQEALGRVCAHIGYRLVIVGTPRPAPVLVHVQARETPVLHILRELGLQTGPYEQIRVVEEGRFIELTWLDPATNLPNRYGPVKKKHAQGSRTGRDR